MATLTEIGKRHDVLAHFAQAKAAETPAASRGEKVSLRDEVESMRQSSLALEGAKGGMEPPMKGGKETR